MKQVVSITSRGQLTLPKALLKNLGVTGQAQAVVEKKGGTIIVKPKRSFSSLESSLSSRVKLSDRQLKQARKTFSKKWARHA